MIEIDGSFWATSLKGIDLFFDFVSRPSRGRNTLSKAAFGLRLSTSVKVSLHTRRYARDIGGHVIR